MDGSVPSTARKFCRISHSVSRALRVQYSESSRRLLAAKCSRLGKSKNAKMSIPIATSRSVTGIPTARLVTWWVIASEIFIFGGLLASYLIHRLAHPEWAIAASHTNTAAGAFNTFVLLTSSLFAVLAHKAADADDGARAARYLRMTALGGLIFLCVKSFEWTHEIREGYVLA